MNFKILKNPISGNCGERNFGERIVGRELWGENCGERNWFYFHCQNSEKWIFQKMIFQKSNFGKLLGEKLWGENCEERNSNHFIFTVRDVGVRKDEDFLRRRVIDTCVKCVTSSTLFFLFDPKAKIFQRFVWSLRDFCLELK